MGVNGLINSWKGIIYLHDIEDFQKDLRTIKPYLRPMLSMTKEEKTEWFEDVAITLNPDKQIDFYNKYYIDYRGLILMELALEAPKEMYNIK